MGWRNPAFLNLMNEGETKLFDFLTSYSSPNIDELKKIGEIESAWRILLKKILKNCPSNGEREKAINYSRIALFWAREAVKNASADIDC